MTVGWAVGSHREWCEWVPGYQKVRREHSPRRFNSLLSDSELRQKIGDEAQRRVDQFFSDSVIADRTLDWYRSVTETWRVR